MGLERRMGFFGRPICRVSWTYISATRIRQNSDSGRQQLTLLPQQQSLVCFQVFCVHDCLYLTGQRVLRSSQLGRVLTSPEKKIVGLNDLGFAKPSNVPW